MKLESPHAFADTVQRLLAGFAEKGIKVFATIDHQAAARSAGLTMPPTTVVIFGNPEAGTPLMLANWQVAVDLPLKVLVCEPEPGHVAVLMPATSEIVERYSLPQELAASLAYAEQMIASMFGAGE